MFYGLAWAERGAPFVRPESFAPDRSGRYQVLKAPFGVDAGMTVTVTVPRQERHAVALVFRTELRELRLRLGQADTSFTFRACADRATGFPGGLLVAGARCVVLELRVQHRAKPLSIRAPFGVETCHR